MRVDFMRRIDRRIGKPVCAILSAGERIRRLFRIKKEAQEPKNILFMQISEMGSIVISYSLFKKIQDFYPSCSLYFLTFHSNRYAIDSLKIIPRENVISLESSGFFSFLLSCLKAVRRTRKARIDTVIDLELFARFTAAFGYLSGARSRIGFHRYTTEGLYRGSFLTHPVLLNPHIHMAHNFLNLGYALKAPNDEHPKTKRDLDEKDIHLPRAEITREAVEDIRKKLSAESPRIGSAETLILLNPNASEMVPIRRWPPDRYIELGRRILERKDTGLVITGVESEREEADILCRALESERCVNMAGKTTFSELLALYAAADLLITNDSGPAHFAAMAELPTFILFGPETPRLYGPLGKTSRFFYSGYSCSPCVSAFNHRKSPCTDNKCLQVITVDQVFRQFEVFMSENPAAAHKIR